jgi:hypothetical protein
MVMTLFSQARGVRHQLGQPCDNRLALKDSGTARGDGTFGDELEKAGEKLVDVDTALELGELGEELGG